MRLMNKIALLFLLSSISLNAQEESFEYYVTPFCECGNDVLEENSEALEALYNAWVVDTTLRYNKPLRGSALDSILHADLSDSELAQLQIQEEALARMTEGDEFEACIIDRMELDDFARIEEVLLEMDSFKSVQEYLDELDCEATALMFRIVFERVHYEMNRPPRTNR
ncbi:MAG: hypothetical protein HWD92_04795 [Flavobacteriia bacterium]|nr:hypothetical protein [Flavobacteriia bacterium]